MEDSNEEQVAEALNTRRKAGSQTLAFLVPHRDTAIFPESREVQGDDIMA
jgi:hypothetical protein